MNNKKSFRNAMCASAGALAAAMLLSCSGGSSAAGAEPFSIGQLGIDMPPGSAREYSYTDKRGGFYYGRAGADSATDWHAGWNVDARRIFADYELRVDGSPLERASAVCVVYPDRLVRRFGAAVETFCVLDSPRVLWVGVDSVRGSRISIALKGGSIADARFDGGSVLYVPKESPGRVVRVAPAGPEGMEFAGGTLSAPASARGFVITLGSEQESADAIDGFRLHGKEWMEARTRRMQGLLDSNPLRSSSDSLDRAMAWLMLTNDGLVTRQHGGWGMYAGLPWFTDFWGRDMFISMPGAVLCTGQFTAARDILASFARYQDTDSASSTYGRVPNRLNLDGVLYNTTDGTPRFVMQVREYLKYTGDTAFVKEIYPAVKTATDASLRLYTDNRGYLTHADADTWMDAKRQGKYPCSPRGDRAVDVQALWYEQLTAAAGLARYMGRTDDEQRWATAAGRLRDSFREDFTDAAAGMVYDHLNADGTPDMQLRPNAIYALEMVADDSVCMRQTRRTWERLVYPWGVASLDQDDPQFHPYHEQWHRYHKDDAYHNGTIWLWNNGMAMQRMLEYGQTETAYALLRNMNRQALAEGAAGSLAENADAWPLPGRMWVRRSGTFLQAWSNSEHLRVWHEYFLGVRPDMLAGTVTVAPRLPEEITRVDTRLNIVDGTLDMQMRRGDSGRTTYRYTRTGSSVRLRLDIGCYAPLEVALPSGASLVAEDDGATLTGRVVDASGSVVDTFAAGTDALKAERQKAVDAYFAGTRFAEPSYRENLPSMSRYFDPPLDYQSVE